MLLFFGGTLCPSPKSQHIFKTDWILELLLCDFSFYVFSIKKSLVPPISPHVCCHGNHTTFGLFLKTRIAIVFQVFSPERNSLWDNLLCFGHPNTLRSLIKANIRTVAMDTENHFAQIWSSTLKQLISAMFHSL